jgi:hypothetical protein
MKSTFLNTFLILQIVIGIIIFSIAYAKADSLTVGNTVDLVGTLNIKPAGSILFSDGSSITSALNLGGSGGSSSWGSITGTITNQTDLMTYFGAKENTAYKGVANGYAALDATGKVPAAQLPSSSTLAWGNITGSLSSQTDLNTALVSKESTALKGQANGYAPLDSNGRVPALMLPPEVYADVAAVWGQITGLIQNQTDLQTALDSKQNISEKALASGYASLDQYGKVPMDQLPQSFNETIYYKHEWAINDETIVWHTQGNEWQNFIEPMTVNFLSDHPAVLRVRWSDNIGI